MEKIQYLTIKEGIDAIFDKYISTKLQEGWTLYGNPYIDEEGNYCQARRLVLRWRRCNLELLRTSLKRIHGRPTRCLHGKFRSRKVRRA